MSSSSDSELKTLFFDHTPLIDVRAPVEFRAGSLPGSVNLPILNDEERALVGTCYKQQGQAAAIALGHELVSGENKELKIKAWIDFLAAHPSAQVFCFRGGMRSQISCQWLRERGVERTPIRGGYKRMRNFFLDYLNKSEPEFFRLGGLTGSGKTRLLKEVPVSIDLEALANHRGSAFGSLGPQPSQVTFENDLSLSLMKHEGKKTVVEDESITIGKCVLPSRTFVSLRKSPLILLKVSDEERISNIFHDYVLGRDKEIFLQGLTKVQKRLSGKMLKDIQDHIHLSFNRGMELKDHASWISLLLKHYYDPFYQKDLRGQQQFVCFEGNKQEVLEFLRTTSL